MARAEESVTMVIKTMRMIDDHNHEDFKSLKQTLPESTLHYVVLYFYTPPLTTVNTSVLFGMSFINSTVPNRFLFTSAMFGITL